jgi:hypothetical protein
VSASAPSPYPADNGPRNAPATDADRAIVAAITTPDIDAAVNALTAWRELLGIVVDQGGHPAYRPALEVCRRAGYLLIADAYDRAQTERGDPRRAYRNTCGSCSVCRPAPAPRTPRQRKPRRPVQQPLLMVAA